LISVLHINFFYFFRWERNTRFGKGCQSSEGRGNISIRESERMYSVTFNSIRRRVNGSVDMVCQRPGPKAALGVELKKELYEAVIELQKIGHGIRRKKFYDLLATLILRIKQKFSNMTCLLKGGSRAL
jgi:hypothetical protein